MELQAHTRNLSDLLSVNKRYVVPRFQREYSWGKDEVGALWKDICDQLKLRQNKLYPTEYFVGCLVLVGKDSSQELKIVDGQQRLTTLTILLRAVVQTLASIGEKESAQSVYDKYIEGRDDNGKLFFKLVNESPKPYFQDCIQHINQANRQPTVEEERLLKAAYDEFCEQLGDGKLLNKHVNINRKDKLSAIRDQVLSHLKFIHVLVADEDDAYTIFETLNARGINLSAIDLVKNWILKNLPEEHPSDKAKLLWDEIKKVFVSSSERVDKDVFFRHFWISKYNFVNEGRIYRSFRELADSEAFTAESFQQDLLAEAKVYAKLVSPNTDDYKHHTEKDILASLSALNLFRVTAVRPFLMALLQVRAEKKISASQHARAMRSLENFHFTYTAITSSRSSGFDGMYSRAARDLRSATSATAFGVITNLIEALADKRPTLEVFKVGFQRLWFSNDETKSKKVIQYIFQKYERQLQGTKELAIDTISLEHIAPQSTKALKAVYGKIGNLLPLDMDINNDAGVKDYKAKISIYRKSQLKVVAEFVKTKSAPSVWDAASIDARTDLIATLAYEKIWVDAQPTRKK